MATVKEHMLLQDFIVISGDKSKILAKLREELNHSKTASASLIDITDERIAKIVMPSSQTIEDLGMLPLAVSDLNEELKQKEESLSTVYDKERFVRSLRKNNITRKIQSQHGYSFVVRTKNTENNTGVEKHTFISLEDSCRFILWLTQDISNSLEFDVLTGGLNRAGLLHEVGQYLHDPERKKYHYALLFFDIQGFRHINESYGIEVGDMVLQYFYTVLANSLLVPVIYSRVAADNFFCLVREDFYNTSLITDLCRQEMRYNGKTLSFRLICGIYHIDDYSISPENIAGRARLAATFIKDSYTMPWKEFDDSMQKYYVSEVEVIEQLGKALADGEFEPYYQPIVNTKTGRVEMAESLVRWNSSRFGFVPPSSFIPALEKHGGISRVDMYMENHVFKMIELQNKLKKPIVPIDVNLSWVDFGDTELVNQLEAHLAAIPNPNETCRFEITETALAELSESNQRLLKIFEKFGVKLIIDDFGTGYSFASMRDLEFDIIKLDKSLVDKVSVNKKTDLMVESMITMFHKMGAKVVAEGVEQAQQVDFLRSVGCDYIQGYFFYHPMPEDQFLALLDKQEEELGKLAGVTGGKSDNSLESVWVERDVLEAQNAKQQQLLEEAKCLRMLLDEQDIFYFEWDVKTHVDVAPDKFCELYGIPTNDIPNMPENAALCYPDDRDRFRNFYYRAENGEHMGTDYFRMINPDGIGYTWYRKTFYTLFDKDNKPYKVILTMQNCTDMFNNQAMKMRGDILVRQQEVIMFKYTPSDDSLEFNFLGPDGQPHTMVIPKYTATPVQDRGTDQKTLAEYIIENLNSPNPAKSGHVDFYDERFGKELRAHYARVEGALGNLYAIVGQAEDINKTREKLNNTIRAQQEFLTVTECLRRIYNALTFVDISTGMSRIIVLDKAYEGTLSPDMDWYSIIYTYTEKVIKPKYAKPFQKFMDLSTIEMRLQGGTYDSLEYEDILLGWIRGFLIPAERDHDGNLRRVLFASQPITAEKSTIERLTKLSETDGLTNLRNRFSGEQKTDLALHEHHPGTFVILDCDGFKSVNDMYGHSVGDNLLIAIANCLIKINPTGINMRLGGDEYAMYIFGVQTDAELSAMFESFFKLVDDIEIDAMHGKHATISAGAVRYDGHSETDFDKIYREADALLYQSKRTHGNKITFDHISPYIFG